MPQIKKHSEQYYLDVNVIKMPEINSFTYGNDYNYLSQHLNTLNFDNKYIFIINYMNGSNIFREQVFNKCEILYDNIGQIYWCEG